MGFLDVCVFLILGFWCGGVMDFLSWFYVESKVFEFSVLAGGSILRLVERKRWRSLCFWVRMELLPSLLGMRTRPSLLREALLEHVVI